jgi:hypothetical protein
LRGPQALQSHSSSLFNTLSGFSGGSLKGGGDDSPSWWLEVEKEKFWLFFFFKPADEVKSHRAAFAAK